jgi:hypothetical protein
MRPLLALLICATASACASPDERHAGDYRSNWGRCVVQIKGRSAQISYPRGVMSCQIEEPATFRCTWASGTASGKALFRAQPDQTLRGTWGHRDSDSDGGAWVLAR